MDGLYSLRGHVITMSSFAEPTVPSTRRPQKSLNTNANFNAVMDQENATVDVTSQSTFQASRNKSRSKSVGPGGFDTLRQSAGNRRAVGLHQLHSYKLY